MKQPVYVSAFARISLRHPDPDYTGMFPVMEARRMSPLMKRAIAVSQQALAQAGIAVPDAIITGTGLGCIGNTEVFLRSLTGLSDAPLRPTHFMQSTHNTISSLIAIKLQCHGYNATYSQGGISFESALLDAFVQLQTGQVANVLVGAFEEMTPDYAAMLGKTGWTGVRADDGRLSETAVAMVLTAERGRALCEIADVHLSCARPRVKPGVTPQSTPASPDAATPGSPDAAMPGSPDTVMPDSPDTVMPGFPDTVMPGLPDAVMPGLTRHLTSADLRLSCARPRVKPGVTPQSTPASPDAATPGSPDATTPGSPDAAMPGLPDTVMPGFPDTVMPGLPDTVMPGLTRHLTRADYVPLYGDNFCVSALGACDAVESVASGRSASVLLENDFHGKSQARILFTGLCGR